MVNQNAKAETDSAIGTTFDVIRPPRFETHLKMIDYIANERGVALRTVKFLEGVLK